MNDKEIQKLKFQIAELEDEGQTCPRRTLGVKIQQKRKEYGYLQSELADLVGCNRTTIVNIETGHQRITVVCLVSICKELKLSADDLLGINI